MEQNRTAAHGEGEDAGGPSYCDMMTATKRSSVVFWDDAPHVFCINVWNDDQNG